MRPKGLAAALIVAASFAVLPTAATARPGYYEVPQAQITQLAARGTHGYTIFLAVIDRQAILSALRVGTKGSSSSVVYQRKMPPAQGNDLTLDLGRAGHVHGRFVTGTTHKIEPKSHCKGGPTIVETGSLVGSFDFHGSGGFTSFHAHRLSATVTTEPARVCRGRSPWASGYQHLLNRFAEKERRLIAGRPSGSLRFSATTSPPLAGQPAQTFYTAESRRREGPVAIRDSVVVAQPAKSFAVPGLAQLPTTTTVEPPAPFEGSATFEFPSRRTAVLSGDLRVDLPEVGEVRLTDPVTDAGICQGYACTRSLPKALRPQRPKYGLGIGEVEVQLIR
jgi:hypothetical protein